MKSDKKRQRIRRFLSHPLPKFRRCLPLFVTCICRHLSLWRGRVSSHFNFHLLSTTIFRHRAILSVMTETAQPKRGGKPFHSILEPHFDFIRELRQRRKTWQEIAESAAHRKRHPRHASRAVSFLPAQIETRRQTTLGRCGK